jgi:Zn-dependent protease with chaperone function
LLGAAILLLHEQWNESLPGAATWQRLWPYLALIPLPWLLARAWGEVQRQRTPRSRRVRSLARLLPLSVPATYAAMVHFGDLRGFAASWAESSALAFMVATLTPLLALEVGYRRGEQQAAAAASRAGVALPMPAGRLAIVWLVVLPIGVIAALADVTRSHRGLHVFLTSTALGHLCGWIAAVLLLSMTLPLLFVWLLPTTRRLPPNVAGEVHATARALGFSPRQVLALRTDLRVANAALVGPLPWPRYLVLTDALMALLDPFALRGVVAHEVGHARAGHPGLLLVAFVLVPLLCYHALWLWLHDAPTTTAIVAGGALLVLAVFALRLLAHRFEYEADQMSAAALGGALPCIEALRRVGQLAARATDRGSLRHPADQRRIAQLQRWEEDAGERARFARRGRLVRWFIAAVALLAVVGSAWAQLRVWPIDRVLLAHYTGDFPQARARLAELPPTLPPTMTKLVDELRAEVDAASALVPQGGSWDAVRDRLAEGGLEHGAKLLRDHDAKSALPWLSLALSRPSSDPWRQMLYLIASAAAKGDAQRLDRLRQHLASLQPPTEVWDVIKDLPAQADRR